MSAERGRRNARRRLGAHVYETRAHINIELVRLVRVPSPLVYLPFIPDISSFFWYIYLYVATRAAARVCPPPQYIPRAPPRRPVFQHILVCSYPGTLARLPPPPNTSRARPRVVPFFQHKYHTS